MGLLKKKDEDHVQYNGDKTTLLDIKRRHIKENQTIYSGSYAIKNKPVQTSITSTVPLWQSQPARSEVERLVYVKNDILRQMMDWVGGDWVGEVDYGKNTIITYDAPEELKQKTDWNENFDQALADNFGMQLCTGDLPISIQMANYIWMRESSRKFADLETPFEEKELNGFCLDLDVVGGDIKTYAVGMKYTSIDDGETIVEIASHFGTLTPDQVLTCFIGLSKYIARNILKWCEPFVPNQNQMDSLFRRYYSSPGVAEKLCKRLSKGESPQHLFEHWDHFTRCTYKDAGSNIIEVTDDTRPADARNCEECRNWFIGVFPKKNYLLGKFEDWTYGADIVGASGGGMSGGGGIAGNYSVSGAAATPIPSTEGEMKTKLGMGNVSTVEQAKACSDMMTIVKVNGLSVQVHKKLANAVKAALEDVIKSGFIIKDIGGFCARLKKNGKPTTSLSTHSFGAAIDINAFHGNPYFHGGRPKNSSQHYNTIPIGSASPDWAKTKGTGSVGSGYDPKYCIWTLDHPVVQIMRKHGFGWGGQYGDTMHFSWCDHGN